ERQSRRWHFYFLLEKILPFEVYLTFTTRLRQAFQHIADVRFSIRAKDPSFGPALIADYWKTCLGELEGMSP
ncbi:hypothetical protein LI156_26115, partial [Blautia producta]